MLAMKALDSFSSFPDCHENIKDFVDWMLEDLQNMKERMQQNLAQKNKQKQTKAESDDHKNRQQDDKLIDDDNDDEND